MMEIANVMIRGRSEGEGGVQKLPCANAAWFTQTLELGKGEALYRTGDPCSQFVMVTKGVLRVRVVSRKGREIVLYRVHAGEFCMATVLSLLCDTPYRADGIAEDNADIAVSGARRFHECMDEDRAFRNLVLGALAARVNDVVGLLQDVAFESINSRLALLLLARRIDACEVHDTHEGLALELGSTREVVSRRLKEFERHGWVRLSRGRVTLLDVSALKALSNPV